MEMHALITGGTGRLGRSLTGRFPRALAPSRAEMDLEDSASIRRYVGKIEIDVAIHAAAMTGIRRCESDRRRAWAANVDGTERLLENALRRNKKVYFILISTAGVFDGAEGNYDENSVPYPNNFYGLTKLIAEERIRPCPTTAIVRTNFISRDPWPHPGAFTDRWGTYLFATGVARAVEEIVSKRPTGVLHVRGDRKLSLFEVARMTSPNIRPMTMAEHDGPPLGRDLSLTSTRWEPYSLND